ncbi:MAG TPA: hypothetical protein VGM67_12205 [Gemmatimonadaceae bacterium]
MAEIVRRKDLERTAGRGLFFWGIGSSLGDSLNTLVHQGPPPVVLFSIMRTPPKKTDSAPAGVLLWTNFIDAAGRSQPLPPHTLITSRSTTGTGDKTRHYALVCHSDTRLRLERLGELNASHLWNLGSATTRVGSSQVTAVVEHGALYSDDVPGAGPFYEVNMRARLAVPYFVRLSRPLLLPQEARFNLTRHMDPTFVENDWMAHVHRIRVLAEEYYATQAGPDLFSTGS